MLEGETLAAIEARLERLARNAQPMRLIDGNDTSDQVTLVSH